ncbi:MAG TPA: M81 family metallopeptidase, partial [Candidatus Pygmaiobacter gallistercoris]|nr:M81 family metallopeptidase [Candidatus Pygmaiobacter gallistercoris]
HGNLEADFADYVNIFRCYHTAPHTDQTDTYRRTAAALARALDEGRQVSTEMVKVPMIFPGEMAATTTEPVRGLIAELDRLEAEDDAVECASLYIGFAWTDAPRTGATVAVVPARAEDQAYCRALARRLADLAFSKRREFGFEMESYDTAGSIAAALSSPLLPVCVTDMGDNPTAGTNGGSNLLLRELLAQNKNGMRALVSGICDGAAVRRCEAQGPGPIALSIGIDIDEVTRPLPVEGELVALFDVMDYKLVTNPPLPRCRGALLRVGSVDIILTDQPFSFIHTVSFENAPVQMSDYQLLVTKFGYIYPDLKQYAKRYIMANTPGESYQMVTEFEFHHLRRPVYPFDPI